MGGNPIRQEYFDDPISKKVLDLSWQSQKTCLIFGGSQGALALNRFIEQHYDWFEQQSINVIHLVGKTYYLQHYSSEPYCAIQQDNGAVIRVVMPYASQMDRLYQWADSVISRAGASSISELIYFQKPADH